MGLSSLPKEVTAATCVRQGSLNALSSWYYLPTPPLGQDMTQGQFLSGV